MAFTYSKLAEVTLSSSASSINFTNIPQNYNDLQCVISVRNTGSGAGDSSFLIRFNGSTTGYTGKTLYADGTASSSFNETSAYLYANVVSTWTASTFGNASIYIPNYTSANNKVISADGVGENNATRADSALGALIWSNTTAISSITIQSYGSFSFATHSTAYLYGVKAEV
jgi:hypothetical protein